MTLGMAIVLATYELVRRIMAGSLSSEGAVIFGLTTSILIVSVAGAVLFYLYSLITSLTIKTLIFTSRLYAALAVIVFLACIILTALAEFGYGTMLTIVILLLLVFLTTYFVVGFVIKRDSK